MTKKDRNQNKSISTKLLVEKALKSGIKWKPAKGYKYLKDLDDGCIFITEGGMVGKLIECVVNAKVYIQDAPNIEDEDDLSYYLGRKIISANTEVKEVKWVAID